MLSMKVQDCETLLEYTTMRAPEQCIKSGDRRIWTAVIVDRPPSSAALPWWQPALHQPKSRRPYQRSPVAMAQAGRVYYHTCCCQLHLSPAFLPRTPQDAYGRMFNSPQQCFNKRYVQASPRSAAQHLRACLSCNGSCPAYQHRHTSGDASPSKERSVPLTVFLHCQHVLPRQHRHHQRSPINTTPPAKP
jgi:hypothetical protein